MCVCVCVRVCACARARAIERDGGEHREVRRERD